MILGAIAFFVYALSVTLVLRRFKPHALIATLTLMPIWFAVSMGLWLLVGMRQKRIVVDFRLKEQSRMKMGFDFYSVAYVPLAGLIVKRFGVASAEFILLFRPSSRLVRP